MQHERSAEKIRIELGAEKVSDIEYDYAASDKRTDTHGFVARFGERETLVTFREMEALRRNGAKEKPAIDYGEGGSGFHVFGYHGNDEPPF